MKFTDAMDLTTWIDEYVRVVLKRCHYLLDTLVKTNHSFVGQKLIVCRINYASKIISIEASKLT